MNEPRGFAKLIKNKKQEKLLVGQYRPDASALVKP